MENAEFHHHATYPNGLRLITVPMDNTRTVTVLVLVATGSRYETKEISGISHFLEHLMFKGTRKRPGYLDISEELDSLGADYNAFTSKEYTGYYVKCAADRVDNALDIISDIFQNSKFDEGEMDKERGPIKEEINMNFDSPVRHVAEIYDELVFGDQPLGWSVAGKKETIDRLQRGDIVDYFTSHYHAKNTVVIVAGNIATEQIQEKVGQYFGNVRESGLIKPIATIENQSEPGLKIFHKATDQVHINIGFRAYSRFHPKYEALEVLAHILGGGMSSRLFVEVREKRGLAYRVNTSATAYSETGDVTTYAGLNTENLKSALEIILKEHKRLTEEPVSDQELTRVKEFIKGRFAIGLETSDEQASFYGEQELLENKILTPEERLNRILAVTKEDIMAVAVEIFRPERLNLAIVGPLEDNNLEIKEVLRSWYNN